MNNWEQTMGVTQDGFSERLRQLRRSKKLTQGELAELVGISLNHVGRMERGVARPGADTLKQLAVALEVTGDYLLNGDLKVSEGGPPILRDPRLLEKFREIEKLPQKDRDTLAEVVDAFLIRRKVRDLAAAG